MEDGDSKPAAAVYVTWRQRLRPRDHPGHALNPFDNVDPCVTVFLFCSSSFQPEKTEVVRTKRKYEKKPKIPPLSAPQHSGPSVFNPKDLNQYDFPSSDDEPFSQVNS